jgi:hypothetical protein
MTSHMTHLRAEQYIADMRRAADHRWLATTPDAEPAKPRRKSARRRWLVLSLVAARRSG